MGWYLIDLRTIYLLSERGEFEVSPPIAVYTQSLIDLYQSLITEYQTIVNISSKF